jgi:hypothetical protein
MKRTLMIIVACLSIGLLMLFPSCEDNQQESSFNFIFKYGVTARNVLNTFQGTFTKDMVLDPAITTELTLTEMEMDSIYQKMEEIEFFSYHDEFEVEVPESEVIGMITPYSTYYFEVEYASGTKEVKWEDKITNTDEKADKLRELIDLIINIIELKPEYQNLPTPSGGYM